MSSFLDKVIQYGSQSLTPWVAAKATPVDRATPLEILFGSDHSSDDDIEEEIAF